MADNSDFLTNYYENDTEKSSTQDKETDDYMCSEIIQSVMASLYPKNNDDDLSNREITVVEEVANTITEKAADNHYDILEDHTIQNDTYGVRYENTNVKIDNNDHYDVTSTDPNDDVINNQGDSVINFDELFAGIYGSRVDEERNENAAEIVISTAATENSDDKDLEVEASTLLENLLDTELEREEIDYKYGEGYEERARRVNFDETAIEYAAEGEGLENEREEDKQELEEYETIVENSYQNEENVDGNYEDQTSRELVNSTEAVCENFDEHAEDIYDEAFSIPQFPLNSSEMADEVKEAEEVITSSSKTNTQEIREVVTLSETVSTTTNSVTPTRKQQPPSSGKFLMRAVAKADPHHVIRCVTDNQSKSTEHNPEQDELVTYLKGDASEISQIRGRIKSLITSPLIQQFNKESESGNEVGQAFFPKLVGVAGSTIPASGTSREEVSVKVEDAKHEEGTGEIVPTNGDLAEPTKGKIEVLSDPQTRNAQLAKAIEAADFKPSSVKHAVRQYSAATIKNNQTVEPTPIAQGISMYSKQQYKVIPDENQNNATTQDLGDKATPDWKLEIQKRKTSNEYLVGQKPPEPIKLAEIPEWKRALMEKNKQRKTSSSADSNNNEQNVEGAAEWKKEMRQILRQKERSQQEEEIPEWQRLQAGKN